MDNKELGCCNMVIWDILIFILFSCIFLPDTIHIVFRIGIGLASGLLFMVLCSIPVLGIILNIAAGIFWAFTVWLVFTIGEWSFVKDDMVWQWTIKILLGGVFILLHIASTVEPTIHLKESLSSSKNKSNFTENAWTDYQKTDPYTSQRHSSEGNEDMDQETEWTYQEGEKARQEDEKTHQKSERMRRENERMHRENERTRQEYERMHRENERTRQENERMHRENRNSETFDPFADCKTRESVVKRYRHLSRNFHPDMADGDTAQMQAINSLYEKKLKEFE